jgi:hypothetical protein
MGAMQHTRRNDLWRGGAPSDIRPDLAPALWIWYDCNLVTGEILSLSLGTESFYRERDGLSS